MKKTLLLTIIFGLTACGGDSTSTSGSTIDINGIYLASDNTDSMLIDTEEGVLFFDGQDFIAFDKSAYTLKDNVISASYTDTDPTHGYTENLVATFSETKADWQYTITYVDGSPTETLTGSYAKQSDSLPIAELTKFGTSAIDPGTVWEIQPDGSATINSLCTFSGSMTAHKFYYKASVIASGCSSTWASAEGQIIEGIGYTMNDGTKDYLGFVGYSPDWYFWDVVEQH